MTLMAFLSAPSNPPVTIDSFPCRICSGTGQYGFSSCVFCHGTGRDDSVTSVGLGGPMPALTRVTVSTSDSLHDHGYPCDLMMVPTFRKRSSRVYGEGVGSLHRGMSILDAPDGPAIECDSRQSKVPRIHSHEALRDGGIAAAHVPSLASPLVGDLVQICNPASSNYRRRGIVSAIYHEKFEDWYVVDVSEAEQRHYLRSMPSLVEPSLLDKR